jgi:hypothetical protein
MIAFNFGVKSIAVLSTAALVSPPTESMDTRHTVLCGYSKT